ncbi:Kinase interacting family protein isoform 1 [Dorcoceras hygrometricum]|uniref:Kinase interacting family protein isoform 1 n=1 Tax=Dorcoceras hygrometricum TaxID=472368 RepID=A0A2Z7CYN5_9LAMI|nr:Kinase interacting family protein isoform 1 [Dorcoceras hygrometricum]
MATEAKKSELPRWNCNICLENSVWLAENVHVVDQRVSKVLLLTKHDEDLSSEMADNQLQLPELIAHIKEISLRHHLLAERYANLTEIWHDHDQSGSHQCVSLTTPVKDQGTQKFEGQGVESDLSLSSVGGISDASPNDGSESSLSSDSDSESFNSSSNEILSSLPSGKMMNHKSVNMEADLIEKEKVVKTRQEYAANSEEVRERPEYEMLLKQISKYEQEVKVSNKTLQLLEEEIVKLKCELQKNESVTAILGKLEAELLSAKNQINLYEAQSETENTKALKLEWEITDLEAELESKKRQAIDLQDEVAEYTEELLERDLEIQKLNAELQNTYGNFAIEKSKLESRISRVSELLTFHDAKTDELQMQCILLLEEIKKCEAEVIEKEKLQQEQEINRQVDIERLKAELFEKKLLIDTLQKDLDDLKLKYDMLMSDKNGVSAKLQALNAELSSRNKEIQILESNVNRIQSENARLYADSETAQTLKAELESRIKELQKEVGQQRILITDGAEEKREAIRQLCFAIEYYRCGYKELASVLTRCRRPTV